MILLLLLDLAVKSCKFSLEAVELIQLPNQNRQKLSNLRSECLIKHSLDIAFDESYIYLIVLFELLVF